jgi:uncharacterized membrane protein
MGRIGTGVTLLVIGAILSFAVQVNIPGVGEHTLGIILMLAGLLVLLLSFVVDSQRRRSHTVVEERAAVVDEGVPVVDDVAPVVRTRRRRRFLA